MSTHKKQMRKLKREIKQAGNKRRRQQLKRDLTENPSEAHFSEEDLGRNRSEGLNGLDQDTARKEEEE